MLEQFFHRPSTEMLIGGHKIKRDLMDTVSDTKVIESLIKFQKKEGKDISELEDTWMKCKEFRIKNNFSI